jgi:hypothetical protein
VLDCDIAITATAVAVGLRGEDADGTARRTRREGRVVTRRKQVGYKLLDIPLDTAHNFRAAAHDLANRCEPDELQYLRLIAMTVVDQAQDDTGITHATMAQRANRLRSRLDRLTKRRVALSAATRGDRASTWRLIKRSDGTVIFEGDPRRVERYTAELERQHKHSAARLRPARVGGRGWS